MNNDAFTLGRAWSEFKSLSLAAQVYIVCFVLIFASGSTPLLGYVPHLMLAMLGAASFSVIERERAGRARSIKLGHGVSADFLMLLFIALFCGAQATTAYSHSIAVIYSKRYLIYAALSLFVVEPTVFAICIRVVSVYLNVCALSLIGSTALLGSKTGGLLGNYQAGGMMMSIACVLNVIDYYRSSKSSVYLWLTLLTVFALLFTGKRTFALIALAGVFVLYFFSSRGKKSFLKVVLIALLLVAVCFIAYEFTDFGRSAFERFALLTGKDETDAMSGRNLLWDVAWITFQEHPVTGIGFGSFANWYATFYMQDGRTAYLTHNIYYGMLAEMGIVGTSFFIALFAWGLVSTVRTLLAVRHGEHGHVSDYVLVVSLALQIWFIAYGFTGNGIYDANEMFFYVIALVMNLSVRHALKIEELDSKPVAENPRRKEAAHA